MRGMLTEQQCELIEKGLNEAVEPRKVAAYLCLHMGLMLAEAAALRWGDIDLAQGTVTLRYLVARGKGETGETVSLMALDGQRVLPMPPPVKRYLEKNKGLYPAKDCFLLSGGMEPPEFYHMQNILSSVCKKYRVADTLSAMDLRNAFIRRCVQAGVDLYSLCAYIGIKQPNVIVKRFEPYFTPRLDQIGALNLSGGQSASAAQGARKGNPISPRRMNLLILGAGSQGPVVKEIAEAVGVFQEIAFLDDDPANRLAMDACGHFEKYLESFPIAIPSFGDCDLRCLWADKLEAAGFLLPKLIHPSATISSSALLAEGVVIEAKAILSGGVRVSRNTIISAGAVLDKGCTVGANTHIGCSCTIAKDSVVPPFSRLPAGMVYGVAPR